jgi:hypothetical protein
MRRLSFSERNIDPRTAHWSRERTGFGRGETHLYGYRIIRNMARVVHNFDLEFEKQNPEWLRNMKGSRGQD